MFLGFGHKNWIYRFEELGINYCLEVTMDEGDTNVDDYSNPWGGLFCFENLTTPRFQAHFEETKSVSLEENITID